MTTLEIIDQIHELILEDRRISAKSIAEQLGISHEQVGSIHENLGMQKLSVKWVKKCLNKNVSGASRLSNFRNFFSYARPKRFPVAVVDHGRNPVVSL